MLKTSIKDKLVLRFSTTSQAMELSEQPLAVKNVQFGLYVA
jgi:hypothetical protein